MLKRCTMKHNRAEFLRSRDPTDIFYKRVLDMMRDYEISLAQALSWDMDGFMPFPQHGMLLTDEEDIEYYLHVNYLPESSRVFFSGVMQGKIPDYGLTNEEEDAEQKDAGSSSTA